MDPEIGGKVIAVAKSLIGSHYINGGYGATPGKEDGCPCRPGGIRLVADPNRLNPAKLAAAEQNLAVFAAEMNVNRYCVCAGNYHSFSGGRTASPIDRDLVGYLDSLKGKPPATWPNYYNHFTPRRAFGPGPGGELGGTLVWGQSCKGIRHFDCVGFISYCYWKATGSVIQLDIKAWRKPGQVGTVYLIAPKKTPKPGEPVVEEAPGVILTPPASLMDGDILVKGGDHHIGYVSASGVIYEAQDTHLGVQSSSNFSLSSNSSWKYLVRVGAAQKVEPLEWPFGWWKVWDGNTYYYYLAENGVAKYTKSAPLNTRTPPKQFVNAGTFTIKPPNHLIVTWNKVAGATTNCVETFYNAEPDCDQMNAKSNLYGPLGASRLS
ncbi:hypothetical protein NA78x_005983 [Anatilimnocola sp. NA78]|uniref:hypothetical protein n=1 Tax=Anatilimnocola sp. NA78 TaxID=3415683 RepID=UPI003CE56289